MGRNVHFPCGTCGISRHYQTSATFVGSNPNAHCGTKGHIRHQINLCVLFEDNISINQLRLVEDYSRNISKTVLSKQQTKPIFIFPIVSLENLGCHRNQST